MKFTKYAIRHKDKGWLGPTDKQFTKNLEDALLFTESDAEYNLDPRGFESIVSVKVTLEVENE